MTKVHASARAAAPRAPLSLALQGGGSFGAFTWGVLDRLLEAPDLALDTISGASAGAVNAVLLADGVAEGGAPAARRKLAWFWEELSRRTPNGATALAMAAFGASVRMFSPVAVDPPALTPLRALLSEGVDFARLRARAAAGIGPRLLIAATRVRDGRAVLFRGGGITLDTVLASCCLPFLGAPVMIDGEACWDGGYSANPPLRALVAESDARDVLLVRLLPASQDRVPSGARGVARRMQELAFNAPLQREADELALLRDAGPGWNPFRPAAARKLARLRLHEIAAPEAVLGLDQESALDTGWSLLARLMAAGRHAATAWLATRAIE